MERTNIIHNNDHKKKPLDNKNNLEEDKIPRNSINFKIKFINTIKNE